jgi:hypothetical protein
MEKHASFVALQCVLEAGLPCTLIPSVNESGFERNYAYFSWFSSGRNIDFVQKRLIQMN